MKKLSKRILQIGIISIALSVVTMYILSQQVAGDAELYTMSKLVEWTGMVFLPLFGQHPELFPGRSGKLAGITAHTAILCLCYPILPDLNYIVIAVIALFEIFILALLSVKVRERWAAKSEIRNGPK